MFKPPALTAGAVQALARVTLGSPNCLCDTKALRKWLKYDGDRIPLVDLARNYNSGRLGMASQLAWYSISRGRRIIDSRNVELALCIEHRGMVRAASRILDLSMQSVRDEHFEPMTSRGFVISSPQDRASYLLSCLGKVGEIVELTPRLEQTGYHHATVSVTVKRRSRTRHIRLENVVISDCNRNIPTYTLRDKRWDVALHFASGFDLRPKARRDKEHAFVNASGLINCSKLPDEIDYTKWLGGNLTAFTEKQLGKPT